MNTRQDYDCAIRDHINGLEPKEQVKVLVERCTNQAMEIQRQHARLMRPMVERETPGDREERRQRERIEMEEYLKDERLIEEMRA